MKNIGKTTNLSSSEFFFSKFVPTLSDDYLQQIHEIIYEGVSYIKRKVTSHRMRYTFIIHYPPQIMEVKTHLDTTKVKLPVTSRVNPP